MAAGTSKRDELSGVAREAPVARAVQAPPEDIGTEDLVLDPDDLRALQIFHKSFNLPGLRLGLVSPISRDDYYPDDFEEEGSAPASYLQQQANATQSLLQQAQAMLGEIEIAEEVETASPMAHGPGHRGAAPVRGSVKPRSAGTKRPGGR